MTLPIVVTHPSTLFHNGLRHLFAKSRFRPVRISSSLTEDLQKYLESLESCVWLTGVEGCVSSTNTLLRKVVTANPGVKAVVLASFAEARRHRRGAACRGLWVPESGPSRRDASQILGIDRARRDDRAPPIRLDPGCHRRRRDTRRVRQRRYPGHDQRQATAYPALSGAIATRSDRGCGKREPDRRCPVSVSPRDADLAHADAGRIEQGDCTQFGHHRVHGEGAHEGHLAKAASAKSYASGHMGAQSRQRSRLEQSGRRGGLSPLGFSRRSASGYTLAVGVQSLAS